MPYQKLDDVPWATWVPQKNATLMFVVEPDRVLLIRKKRGLGAGKINAPGGHIDAGETPLQAAIRETQEELHVTPIDPVEYGTLAFQFVDGLSLFVHAFRADQHTGTPTETDEATPHWFSPDAIPFDDMWADDRVWLPHLLSRRSFKGRFLFDGDTMLGHHLDVDGEPR